MTITVGDTIPSATLTKVTPDGPDQVSTDDFFRGRTVALFAVPGAFTPTCSARHLPGFVEKRDALAAKGVDEIACTSVNDAFVMGATHSVTPDLVRGPLHDEGAGQSLLPRPRGLDPGPSPA